MAFGHLDRSNGTPGVAQLASTASGRPGNNIVENFIFLPPSLPAGSYGARVSGTDLSGALGSFPDSRA